jgi:hypothetical protein
MYRMEMRRASVDAAKQELIKALQLINHQARRRINGS